MGLDLATLGLGDRRRFVPLTIRQIQPDVPKHMPANNDLAIL